jgi:hypothetical protein
MSKATQRRPDGTDFVHLPTRRNPGRAAHCGAGACCNKRSARQCGHGRHASSHCWSAVVAAVKGALAVAMALKTPEMLPRGYTREAFKLGPAYETKLGVNPFKFGLIGSTDMHTGLVTTTEDNCITRTVILGAPSASLSVVYFGRAGKSG